MNLRVDEELTSSSGTTGKPKGVEVMHGNVTNRTFCCSSDFQRLLMAVAQSSALRLETLRCARGAECLSSSMLHLIWQLGLVRISVLPTCLKSFWILQEILGSLSNGCTLCVRGKSSKEWRAVMKTVDIVIGQCLQHARLAETDEEVS